jgi:hypothetical protein
MCLFLAGMLLIVLAGNAVLAFVGWELAGISSWLLIAYAWERPVATANALFVFVVNRVGDAGFLLGIGLAVWSVGSLEWAGLAGDGTMSMVSARLLAAGFVLAAVVKSAQLPFTPWIARALEGPTPSSAVFYGSLMVHAGVFLLCRLQGLLLQVPDLMALLARRRSGDGLVRSPLRAGAERRQVGADLLDGDPGRSDVRALRSRPVLAGRLLLRPARRLARLPVPARAVLHASGPPPGAPGAEDWLGRQDWLYTAALQRFWIEALASSLLTRPTLALGRDVRALDEQVIDPCWARHAPITKSAQPMPRLRTS